MSWIVSNIKPIMIVCGVLTSSMLYTVIAPDAAQRLMFGEALEGPLAGVIVRNWGALIALGGALLVYGAYDLPSRRPILALGILGKLVFISLVVSQGARYLSHQAAGAVVGDSIMVVLFALYLIATPGHRG